MYTPSFIQFLNDKVVTYNQPNFIAQDPICIPHQFSKQQDIEIAGFFAALFAWGNRTIIIKKSKLLLSLMDNAPYQFITQHQSKDLKKIEQFKHRTFNATDILYFIHFLKKHYKNSFSLETAFSKWMKAEDENVENALNGFYTYFITDEVFPSRTAKHIAAPLKHSNCKRLNMFLRWMVRKDNNGVDFGIWNSIQPHQLICPIDVHVARVAKKFHLLTRTAIDWNAAIELTTALKKMDAQDPVKYDFALFGLGVIEKF